MISGHMLPGLSSRHARRGDARDVVATTDFSGAYPRGMKRANLRDVGFGQDGLVMFRTMRNPPPPLGVSIRHVVFGRSREEMTDVTARRKVAAMAYVESRIDAARRVFPRAPMRQLSCHATVSELVTTAHPRPARIRTAAFVDLRPELFFLGNEVQSPEPPHSGGVDHAKPPLFGRPRASRNAATLSAPRIVSQEPPVMRATQEPRMPLPPAPFDRTNHSGSFAAGQGGVQ